MCPAMLQMRRPAPPDAMTAPNSFEDDSRTEEVNPQHALDGRHVGRHPGGVGHELALSGDRASTLPTEPASPRFGRQARLSCKIPWRRAMAVPMPPAPMMTRLLHVSLISPEEKGRRTTAHLWRCLAGHAERSWQQRRARSAASHRRSSVRVTTGTALRVTRIGRLAQAEVALRGARGRRLHLTVMFV